MALAERMQLAESRPLPRKLFAAMAQQDCGQCGYLCESYADKLASGEEKRQNLCVPGGKETSRMLKRLLEELPASAPAPAAAPAIAPQPAAPSPAADVPGSSRERPVTAIFRSATRLTGAASEKDTRHIVFDISRPGIGRAGG